MTARSWSGWAAGRREPPRAAVDALVARYTERYGHPPKLVVTYPGHVHQRPDGIVVRAPNPALEPICRPGEYYAEILEETDHAHATG